MSTTPITPITEFLTGPWQMVPGERAALDGLLARVRPALAIEIGTAEGGSLRCIAARSAEVHAFDLTHPPALAAEVPNATLHTGDSHALLPAFLAALADAGRSVDFALVDGDHSAAGARRDVEDLLASPAVRHAVIVAHDAANEEVRAGLEAVDYGAAGKVAYVDLDFVPGHVSRDGPFAGEVWGGLALIVVDAERDAAEPPGGPASFHPAGELLRLARDAVAAPPPPTPTPAPAADPRPRHGSPITMDVPALPWTEHALPWASPATRLRVQQGWERIPRRRDLLALRSWRAGARMHRELFRDGHTMLYPLRARTLHRLARHADRDEIPGALVDCGSWNGGSTALLSAGSPRREVWAFDSFAGLPAPTIEDVPDEETLEQYEAVTGWLQASPDRVRAAVARFGRPEHLHVVGGWLAETLPEAAPGIGPIAVLHIDVDWYESVRLALEHLYPLVSPGGWVVIDDYGAVPGAGLATREFRWAVGDDAPLVRVDQTGRYWRKRP